MRHWLRITALCLGASLQFAWTAHSAPPQPDPIGTNLSTTPRQSIFEHTTLQTKPLETAHILMDDDTEIWVGQSSRIEFRHWHDSRIKDSTPYLHREIFVHMGLVLLKVQRVYSMDEPFLVTSRYGATAVLGTEYAIEVGELRSNPRASNAKRYDRQTLQESRHEMELHVIEGEVRFVKSVDDLNKTARTLTTGETSLIRKSMAQPQTAHRFELDAFQKYLGVRLPSRSLQLSHTTNERRAERAINAKRESIIALLRIDPTDPKHPNELTSANRNVASPARSGHAKTWKTR